jgi:hypothetical protein
VPGAGHNGGDHGDSMNSMAEEGLDLLNDGHFRVTDPGPLHAPIHAISVRRDDSLTSLKQKCRLMPGRLQVVSQFPKSVVSQFPKSRRLTSMAP